MKADRLKREKYISGRHLSTQKIHLNAEEVLERKLGFDLFTEGDKRLGWLLTFAPSSWGDQETNKIYSCVDLYFISQDGSTFKVKYRFPPYFYAATKDKMELEIEAYLRRKYEGKISDIEILDKEDLDLFNYGGIQAKCAIGCPVASTQDDSQVDIVSSWNIAEYLPKATQDHFVLIVSEFLYIPWKYFKEQVYARTVMAGNSTCTPSITVTAAETREGCVNEYIKEQISNYFAEKLLRIVRDILNFGGGNKGNADQSTNCSSSSSVEYRGNKGDAALEFIKHVCAVLALDQNVQHDVLRMRKNLLKLIHVKEFAPEALFHDPCPSFVLPNIICSYCNDCRDLDLCRDSTILEDEWRCPVPHCCQSYNREQLENSLLQIVRQRERLYHLQDLVCVRCRQVKAAHLAEQCACGGSFRCHEDSCGFLKKCMYFTACGLRENY